MAILGKAEEGYVVWASEKRFGTFDLLGNGTIVINWQIENESDQLTQLYEWQGQGGYLLEDKSGNEMFSSRKCHHHVCEQPVYEYDSNGLIIGNKPVMNRLVWWEDNLFGLAQPVTYFVLNADIKPAPYKPDACDMNGVCKAMDDLGVYDYITLGLYSVSSWIEDVFFDLNVNWISEEQGYFRP